LGLLGAALLVMAAGLLLSLLIPGNSNVLLLGLDSRAGQGNLGRTDTIIVASIRPLAGQVHALSIPRDLWVPIPGVGENRINTAHFFAEANQPGSGPAAAQQVVENNFKVSIDYYARIRFDGFQGIVDAMGGIDIQLDKATGTLPAGQQHLNGEQALAFVRDRKEGDDFFRMAHAQILLNAALKQALQPSFWPRLPAVLAAVQSAVDSNIPPWQLPRLGLTFLRAGLSGGLETRSLTREMASPFTTSNGAAVLQPHWDLIQPLVKEFLISPTGR
jgi:LCP family protein required for cell wall assembly